MSISGLWDDAICHRTKTPKEHAPSIQLSFAPNLPLVPEGLETREACYRDTWQVRWNAMALSSDGLFDHLLFKIALSGTQGFDAYDFADAAYAFNAERGHEEVEEVQAEVDPLFSARPPPADAITDARYLETAWSWILNQPDISVKETDSKAKGSVESPPEPSKAAGPSGEHVDGHAISQSDQNAVQDAVQAETSKSAFLVAHANARLYATEDRIWHALTDHGVDWKRLPKLEFQCLTVIAAHGAAGILQPDITAITKQDKRSVPKRTDGLQSKGYITKVPCIGGGLRTSLCRLKKFANEAATSTHFQITRNAGSIVGARDQGMIRYDIWFDEVMDALKRNNMLMAWEDLRKELGIAGKAIETRSLHRCIRRVTQSGLIRRLRARTESRAAVQTMDVNDGSGDRAPPRMLSKKASGWIRCIKLLREPTEHDRGVFMSSTKADAAGDESRLDDKDSGDSDEDATMLDDNEGLDDVAPIRTPPQWTSDMHHTQLLFHLIDNAGSQGLSALQICEQGMSPFWRRPVEEAMSRLTDVWKASQPTHLRHLSIVRDTALTGTVSYYIFRSLGSYQERVDAGESSWSYVGGKPSSASPAELDDWGFPRVASSQMVGRDGIASVRHCRESYIREPRKKNRTSAIVEDFVGTPSSMTAKTPQTPFATAVIQSAYEDDTPAPRLTNINTIKGAARQAREESEWKARARKLAEERAKAELSEERAKTGLPPPRKRGRPRKSTIASAEALASAADSVMHVPSSATGSQLSGAADSNAHHADYELPGQPPTNAIQGTGQEAFPTSPSAHGGSKRKRLASQDEEADQLQLTRVQQIEAEIITRAMPGAYVNPPGSAMLKMANYSTRGRPRNHLIIVFKSDKILNFDWFVSEPARFTPVPPRPRKAGLPRKQETKLAGSEAPAELISSPVNSEPHFDLYVETKPALTSPDTVATLEEHGSLTVNDQAHAIAVTAVPPAAMEGGPPKAVSYDAVRRAPTIGCVDTERLTRVRASNEPIQPLVPHGTSARAPLDTATVGAAVSDVELPTRSRIRLARNGTLTSQALEDMVIAARRGEHYMNVDEDAEVAEETEYTTPANDNHLVYPEPDVFPDPDEPHDVGLTAELPDPALAVWNVVKQKPSDRVTSRTPGPRKVGVQRSGGVIDHQRSGLVLKIIRDNNGMFPGEKSLWYPFATEWERLHQQTPDRKTLERTVKSIVSTNRLRKMSFTFRGRRGDNVTRSILYEPHVDPGSQDMRTMQKKMMDLHPAWYVPEFANVTPEYRASLGAKNDDAINLNWIQDYFPEDPSEVVTRPSHLVAAPRVRLGITEESIKAEHAARRKRAEIDEERRKRRLDPAEGPVDEGIAALSSSFQLESYNHEPKRAKIYRGPLGRSAISRRLKFGEAAAKKVVPMGTSDSIKGRRTAAMRAEKRITGLFGAWSAAASRNDDANAGSTLEYQDTIPQRFDLTHDSGDVLTLIFPSQSFASTSGTFSTNATVPCGTRNLLRVGTSIEQAFARQMPTSLQDLLRREPTRQAPTLQRCDDASARFEEEVDRVRHWEDNLDPEAWVDGTTCNPFRFINHSTPEVFPERPMVEPRWDHSSSKILVPRRISGRGLMCDLRAISKLSPQAAPYPHGFATVQYKSSAPSQSYNGPIVPRQSAQVISAQGPPQAVMGSLQDEPAPDDDAEYVPAAEPAKAKKAAKAQKKLKKNAKPQINVPRATKTGIFSMNGAEEERMVIALVVIRTLTGGLEQNKVNWGFVHQVFHYKFDVKYCRDRWASLKFKHAARVLTLQVPFRTLFVEAYEQGSVPAIDLARPENVDWAGLVDWTLARLDTNEHGDEVNLPAQRHVLDKDFEILRPEETVEVDKEFFFEQFATHLRREEMANGFTYTVPFVESSVQGGHDPLALAKSWVRANVLTPESSYDSAAAHAKLLELGDDAVSSAIDALLGARILRVENKGRAMPGRNYDIADSVLSAFKRSWDANTFKEAAAFKQQLDAALTADGRFEISYHASDPQVMAIENLIANGRVKIVAMLPPIDHDFAAPWPKLTKWGFTEGNYKTVHMDKERLQFGLEIVPTDSYVGGNLLKKLDVPISQQFDGEAGARLPFWTDINGEPIEHTFNMVLISTLYWLSFRPGLTAAGLAKVLRGKLWEWEVELFLQWGEEVGLVRRMDAGEQAGWTTGEWWWLAFAA